VVDAVALDRQAARGWFDLLRRDGHGAAGATAGTRAGSAARICWRCCGLKQAHWVISSIVRPQPMQNPVRGSSWQTSMHGESSRLATSSLQKKSARRELMSKRDKGKRDQRTIAGDWLTGRPATADNR
jgi:hypothetical protein